MTAQVITFTTSLPHQERGRMGSRARRSLGGWALAAIVPIAFCGAQVASLRLAGPGCYASARSEAAF